MQKDILIFFVLLAEISSLEVIQIDLQDTHDIQELPRFWTSTGFCPPAPINETATFLLSQSVKQNLELIASLPNAGLTHIRPHWILELIEVSTEDSTEGRVKFSFGKFNNFLHFLQKIHLSPHIEFMGNPGRVFSDASLAKNKFLWREITFQMLKNSLEEFGEDFVNTFRFETWNEPDLIGYNILNFSLPLFIDYITSVREGMGRMENLLPGFKFKLRGPAGLFHKRDIHKLCYGILEYCSRMSCPIDILTFHRKGLGKAREILKGEIELLRNLTEEFPWITQMQVANDEADPTSGWSRPLPKNTDVRYAAELTKTVLLHWDALKRGIQRGILGNLESISHDNAFLSYHPHEFTQRTLLAHFRMNNSHPVYSEFIKKPVLGALGLLANLAKYSGNVKRHGKVMHMSSQGNESTFYACILLISTGSGMQNITINVKLPPGKNLVAFGEILDQKRTNPVKIWQKNSSPPYPDHKLLLKMRKHQTPAILIPPTKAEHPEFVETFTATAPFVVTIRFCETTMKLPEKIKDVRLNRISEQRVTILWYQDPQSVKCTRNYQVFYKTRKTSKFGRHGRWREITQGWHIPDLSFDFWRSSGISGAYKVRSVDILGRYGEFSDTFFV